VSRRQQKIKRTLVAEAGGRCVVCGYDRCLRNLHFANCHGEIEAGMVLWRCGN
jgi:hypothetical protein